MRKIGIKLWPDGKKFYDQIKEQVDFIEIMAVVGEKYKWLENWKKPIVIHHEHSGMGINHANPKKKKINLRSTKWAQKLATKFKAKKIIVHPGNVENKDCSLAEVVKQLKPLKDKRIIFENLIYIDKHSGTYMFAYNWHELHYLCKKFKTGICLDFSHATISAKELMIDPKAYLKDFRRLPIKHLHICDGKLELPVDLHLHLQEGNFPLKKYLKIFPKNIDITIETGKDIKKAMHDITFVRKNNK